MIKFSKDRVLLLHKILAEATGGSAGMRDEALLDSATRSSIRPKRRKPRGSAMC